jgi:glycosyltransferase involved in cell wall biosynthesis
MVPPRDPLALAEAIRQVLHDESLAKRLAEAGPPTAKDFNWDTCVDRFETALLKAA